MNPRTRIRPIGEQTSSITFHEPINLTAFFKGVESSWILLKIDQFPLALFLLGVSLMDYFPWET